MRKLTVMLAALAVTPLALGGFARDAHAVSEALKTACRGDYETFCKDHEVGSQALRDCMTDAFEKLSPACVTAILDSDEVKEEAATPNPKPKKRAAHASRKKHHVHAHRHDRLAARWNRGKRVARRIVSAIVYRVRHALH
jgi:hypothetical protein